MSNLEDQQATSGLRPHGVPGRHRSAMDHTCGFDGGDDNAEACGQPATHHLFAGSPDKGPSDWAMSSCDQHLEQAKPLAFDWHEISVVCEVPGTIWQSRNVQGAGFCFWPAEEEAIQQSALALTSQAPCENLHKEPALYQPRKELNANTN